SDRCVIDMYFGGGIATETHKKIGIKEIIRDADENAAILEQYRNAIEALRLEEERRRQQEIESETEIKRKLLELYKTSKAGIKEANIRQKEIEEQWRENVENERKRQKAAEEETERKRFEEERKKEEQEAEDKAYEFGPVHTYITRESQYTNPVKHYRSTFINTGNWTKKNVMITISFYDWRDKLLGRRVVHTTPEDLETGEEGKFEADLDATLRAASYKMSPSWVY
ncbi:MAG: FxLYD domain-containing protein, partial [Candidatus Omnitrophota bacterium]